MGLLNLELRAIEIIKYQEVLIKLLIVTPSQISAYKTKLYCNYQSNNCVRFDYEIDICTSHRSSPR